MGLVPWQVMQECVTLDDELAHMIGPDGAIPPNNANGVATATDFKPIADNVWPAINPEFSGEIKYPQSDFVKDQATRERRASPAPGRNRTCDTRSSPAGGQRAANCSHQRASHTAPEECFATVWRSPRIPRWETDANLSKLRSTREREDS
jgi:hypothetical protein